jgi:hypothetical protein
MRKHELQPLGCVYSSDRWFVSGSTNENGPGASAKTIFDSGGSLRPPWTSSLQ